MALKDSLSDIFELLARGVRPSEKTFDTLAIPPGTDESEAILAPTH